MIWEDAVTAQIHMKTSTQKQLYQLLAQLLTTVKPAQLSHERIQVAIKDTDGLAACFCEFVNNYPVATPKVVPAEQSATLISVRKGIPLGNHKARPMSKLFRNRDGVIFYYRDGDFDNWFAENSPECSAGTAELVETSCVMKFRQMTQWLLVSLPSPFPISPCHHREEARHQPNGMTPSSSQKGGTSSSPILS